MDKTILKTGVLGLDHRGEFYLRALNELPGFNIYAVADRNLQRLAQAEQCYHCQVFDDPRQFIIQNDLDCLVVAAGLHSCLEYVRMALKKGIAVLKLAPAGRGFEEARELVELAQNEKIRFDVTNPFRYCDSFKHLQRLLHEKQSLEHPYLIHLCCDIGLLAGRRLEDYQLHPDSETAWITDQELAGGGVLMHNGYALLDQLIQCFGLPEQVYALCNSLASEQRQLHHLTEDAALLCLRFGESLIGDMVAQRHWDDRPGRQILTVHAKEKIATATCDRLALTDGQGNSIEQHRYDFDELMVTKRMLQDYADSFRIEEPVIFTSSGHDNLAPMALIEAAYLSIRTGSPEEPGRLLRL